MAAKKKPALHVVEPQTGSNPPAPPEHLGASGCHLWASIQRSYEIDDPGGLALLQQAAEAADRVADCRETIAAEGAVVGSGRTVRAHPLLACERDARAALLRAIRYLNLDVEPLKAIGRPPGS